MISRLSAAFLAIAFLFTACQTTNPLLKEAKSNISSANYQAALDAANQAIAENASDGLAYYYRGVALGSLGQEQETASARLSFYQQMMAALSTAEAIYDTLGERPEELNNIGTVITAAWASEHNAAVDILTDDSVAAAYADPNTVAVDHLKNAVTLAPDSVVSHSVMASAYYRMNDIESSIGAYETVMSLLDTPDVSDYEFLVSLYLAARRFDDVRTYSMQALEAYPDQTTFVQYLADSYLQTGETEKAIELVRELIARDPDNAQYYLVLGTQIYQSVSGLSDEYSAKIQQIYDMEQAARSLRGAEKRAADANMAPLKEEAAALEARINELTELSIAEITKATEMMPGNKDPFNILGIIYQNRSAMWFEKRNNTSNYDLADEYDAKAREILKSAMENYEKAVALDPENKDYWRSLFQVYTTLGMNEKAEEAMEKAGL